MKYSLNVVLFGTIIIAACSSVSQTPAYASPQTNHPLGFMFGEWVGTASGVGADRVPFTVTQTERVGPILDGYVVLVEGTGFRDNGEPAFNAFGAISCDAEAMCEIRSYSDGRTGTFPFTITDTGYRWSIPAGPNAKMQYTATIDGNNWDQVGEFVRDGHDPVQTFQMSLKRIGDTDWPAAGAVDPMADP